MITKVKSLAQNPMFMRYFKNSSWMLTEYALKIISAIFVSIYVARYLGPENFGVLSYVLAIVAIFMAISRLGMESILVRDLAKHPEQSKAYMGTAFSLMFVTAIISVIVLSMMTYFVESDSQIKLYIWIISTGLIFQAFLAIDYSFQAQVKAKYSSIAKSFALAISSIIKIYLVGIQADLLLFAIAYALDYFVVAFMLINTYIIKKQPSFLLAYNKKLVKPLLKSAWPMMLSAIAAMLYMRIDQIMIKEMLDAHQLGLYAAATKIYEGWIIVPYVLCISLLPAIVAFKSSVPEKYEENFTKLFALVFWTGIIVAVIATLGGEWIIRLTFGEAFVGASSVLAIVMWTAAFTSLGTVSARYLTVEGMEKKITLRTFVALFVNVILNLILIPNYGINGAAIATFITLLISSYFINYTDKDLTQLLKICDNAILFRFTKTK